MLHPRVFARYLLGNSLEDIHHLNLTMDLEISRPFSALCASYPHPSFAARWDQHRHVVFPGRLQGDSQTPHSANIGRVPLIHATSRSHPFSV